MREPVSHIFVLSLITKYSISSSLPSSSCSYNDAKEIRLKYGHSAAVPLYQKLVETYGDVTAATRIAASPGSIIRHDMACPLPSGADKYHLNACFVNRDGRYGRIKKNGKDENEGDDSFENEGNGENSNDEIMIAIQNLKVILKQSGYSCHEKIQRLFGVMEPLYVSSLFDSKDGFRNRRENKKEWNKAESLGLAQGPVYVTPVSSAPISQLPPMILDDIENDDQEGSSLRCLVAMFLLGFAVPRDILLKYLIGGEETIELLQFLGLAFPCEMDSSMIVPYVHIFPLQVQLLKSNDIDHSSDKEKESSDRQPKATTTTTMILVTDLHPTILSRTTVGQKEDGAVMYIGPDSLALVQHLPVRLHVQKVYQQRQQRNHKDMEEKQFGFRILDLCTGSGVQALSMLMSMSGIDPTVTATCVDVNDRALRFVRFNALLNGIDSDRIWTLKADLISGLCLDDVAGEGSSQEVDGKMNVIDALLHGALHMHKAGNFGCGNISAGLFNLILANPPFIPTPPRCIDEERRCISEDISKRYGLFSSGGSSGEEVLQCIVSMSSRLLQKEHGLLAIVSEFMNPPTADIDTTVSFNQDSLQSRHSQFLYKLRKWWEKGPSWLSVLPSSNENINEVCANDVGAVVARGLLFTNEVPISAETYAARRANNNQKEYLAWLHNLQTHGIQCVSPGLLYIQTISPQHTMMTANTPATTNAKLLLDVEHRLVPKCQELGSIWTPYNYKALLYTWCEWAVW
eukprot:CAMPEP_0176478836 /NCGR_PEP_ID=MMETSP0200_2-20121128/1401_1 /TAXON_ID=947934 /ORGANISM="Chaetoceros sp., Strain GSL56" /LENGTH=742 /DNA_ID=CAMNT_0017874805 /DNA_START=27 /DNA_END=2252 /DNA_ORIENTATION=-